MEDKVMISSELSGAKQVWIDIEKYETIFFRWYSKFLLQKT